MGYLVIYFKFAENEYSDNLRFIRRLAICYFTRFVNKFSNANIREYMLHFNPTNIDQLLRNYKKIK